MNPWICPRCGQVWNGMVIKCDCPPNQFNNSNTAVQFQLPLQQPDPNTTRAPQALPGGQPYPRQKVHILEKTRQWPCGHIIWESKERSEQDKAYWWFHGCDANMDEPDSAGQMWNYCPVCGAVRP